MWISSRCIHCRSHEHWTEFTHAYIYVVAALYSSQQVTELSRFKDLPDEVPLPLVIGTKVTGMHFILSKSGSYPLLLILF